MAKQIQNIIVPDRVLADKNEKIYSLSWLRMV